MYATAIMLRGGSAPAQVLIQLRTWSVWSHAALLMDNGLVIEASALKNRVVEIMYHPPDRWTWERQLPLQHLSIKDQIDAATKAVEMLGKKYDWRAARGIALEGIKDEPDDPRRLICFELVARAVNLDYGKLPHEVTGKDIYRAWQTSCKIN